MKLKEAKKEDQYTMESIPPDWDSMFFTPPLTSSFGFGSKPLNFSIFWREPC